MLDVAFIDEQDEQERGDIRRAFDGQSQQLAGQVLADRLPKPSPASEFLSDEELMWLADSLADLSPNGGGQL